jgi:hypothetical protein
MKLGREAEKRLAVLLAKAHGFEDAEEWYKTSTNTESTRLVPGDPDEMLGRIRRAKLEIDAMGPVAREFRCDAETLRTIRRELDKRQTGAQFAVNQYAARTGFVDLMGIPFVEDEDVPRGIVKAPMTDGTTITFKVFGGNP